MRKTNRAAAGAAAWNVVHDSTKPGRPSLAARAGALPRMLGSRFRGHYPELTTSRLLMYLVAVLYIASPIDLVPELFVPFLGFGDDIVVAVWLAGGLMGETERFLAWEQHGPQYVKGNVVG
ncbi:uncharacterized protein DUF1232 [Murinocardiopsis flavida]|uniref:Uncharacterized protein DUF1232 n=1 Tax=Murinocardiopsis flavida TaxID=645275 RepID=A0A2P8DQS8_9ACTN|nr:YkvA family protein [Murinocardiopsis flavida]PSK99571.1 uncharacterized protein DUF1232 [Murinocardiopsis flavida]